LAQVYKAASIADSLSDMQNFLNDMIRTVEQVEERESCYALDVADGWTGHLLILSA
jgi:hypothetical protein